MSFGGTSLHVQFLQGYDSIAPLTMKRAAQFLALVLAAFLGGLVAIWFQGRGSGTESIEGQQQAWLGKIMGGSDAKLPDGVSFVNAAKSCSPAVVYIMSEGSRAAAVLPQSPLEEFFGNPHGGGGMYDMPSESSGSGVIVTPDGYITTNNHVIEGASEVKVILSDKRSYKATVVGTDPTTDLALLKIDATDLPFIRYGDSDKLEVGEWVLALGNPYDLTQTVTAGIVSAKARNINILRTKSNMQVESFIQTDAAVNPGNSGGALINLKGELVGINTAIASQTGSYTGYSFAVPVTIVRKVMEDLLKFGDVQRGVLGVEVREINDDFAKEKGLPDTKGVYVNSVYARSGAADAKLQAGDVIYKINGQDVNSASELVERVARNRPGDKVKVAYGRKGKITEIEVRLKSRSGEVKLPAQADAKLYNSAPLGATLRTATEADLEGLNINQGVKVVTLTEGGLLASAGVQKGFVITSLDKQAVKTPDELEQLVRKTKGGALLEGIYPNGKKAYYALAL